MNKFEALGLLAFLLIIALIVLAPLLGIWAVNLLSGGSIPYEFSTWLAMFALIFLFGRGKS